MIELFKSTKKSKPLSTRNKSQNKFKRKNKIYTIIKIVALALYISFLVLSTVPFNALRTVETNMKDTYEYHLEYSTDGRQSHYYVERVNTSSIGMIDLIYTTKSNSLSVEVKNIKVLHIYCRSMYEDECEKVFGFDPTDNSNYYKWYFIEKDHLNINIDSEYAIDELKFIDTPFATRVIANGVDLVEGKDYHYSYDQGIAISNVSAGRSNIDLYFKSSGIGIPPKAILNSTKTIINVNETVLFDATNSFDLDGEIIAYIYDFGDGTFGTEVLQVHKYTETGTYGVILMVRDDDHLVDYEYLNISVVSGSDLPTIIEVVPNQIKAEDSPPWALELNKYEPNAKSENIEFYWYISGENESLFTVSGENSTNDRLIFTLKPDAFGSDLVTLWQANSYGFKVSQPLWINVTPVNDPPTIYGIPDLMVHYNDPYTFNYEAYVSDIDTPLVELNLSVHDGFGDNYIKINGLKATYNYPKDMVGKIIYATVSVSDTDNSESELIQIKVTSDYVPKLILDLPDITISEGTTEYNVFDLDEYFTDPDDDVIYFSYGYSHISIRINQDHTVDFIAESEWWGIELVTFRATDPLGALAEDVITVTVLPVNDPPIIQGVPDLSIRYQQDYRFNLKPYITDNDNTYEELTLAISPPQNIRNDHLNHLALIFNYPAEYLGETIRLRLTVSDRMDSSFQVINVSITENYPPELYEELPDVVFLEDEQLIHAFNLNNYFIDFDGDVLYYTSGNKYINITINDNNFVDFSAPLDWFGEETVYFRAVDPKGALQEDIIQISVLPVNDGPFILPIPKQIVNESEHVILNLEDYVKDVDNDFSDLDIKIDNEYVVLTGNSLAFLGVEELPNQVTLTASDGFYNATTTIEIEFRPQQTPKPTPIWDVIYNFVYLILLVIVIVITIMVLIYYKKRQYFIDELFLIHKSGILINHLISHKKKTNIDDVIFSGMFTAVQEFIADSFERGKLENGKGKFDDVEFMDDVVIKNEDLALDELKLGDENILIVRSENTYLAILFTGEGIKRLRIAATKILDEIETKFKDVLPLWDGEIKELMGTKEILNTLLLGNKNKGLNFESINKEPEEEAIEVTEITEIDEHELPGTLVTEPEQLNIDEADLNSKLDAKEIEEQDFDFDAQNDEVKKSNEDKSTRKKKESKKVRVKLSDAGEVELDTSRSIIQQLLELEEKNKKK